ncbi:MAG: sulfhydrogenase subunit delta [Pseudomonadota bacterium]
MIENKLAGLPKKPRIGVYKFSSCDGCQLAFLNSGLKLVELSQYVDIIHFVEAGINDEEAHVDIAFVEGSISTPHGQQRIQKIRNNSRYLITIGACATSGGVQALRNGRDSDAWMATVYAKPEYIDTLKTASAIAEYVDVDLELWGCPVSTEQVFNAISLLLRGVQPADEHDSVCIECKRRGNVCVLVTKQAPCMGPVTKTGCGALCPSAGRGCYACYGPSENPNGTALVNRFRGFGLVDEQIAKKFRMIYSQNEKFAQIDVMLHRDGES